MVKIQQKNKGWLGKLLKRWGTQDELAIGWPAGTANVGIRYPDGTPVVLVAAVNTFGSQSRGIPARPFMQQSAEPAIEATVPVSAALIPALNAGKIDKAGILQHMGPYAVAAFQRTITTATWAPNHPETIRRKQSAQPLIDTGLMRQSLTFLVRKPG